MKHSESLYITLANISVMLGVFAFALTQSLIPWGFGFLLSALLKYWVRNDENAREREDILIMTVFAFVVMIGALVYKYA